MKTIDELKNLVAERHGYPDDILGSRWQYAMMLTHRRKSQIQLYEEVLIELHNQNPDPCIK